MMELWDQYDFFSFVKGVLVGEYLFVVMFDVFFDRIKICLIDGIGVIEMIYIFIFLIVDKVCLGVIGQVVLGYQVWIVGEDGSMFFSGEIGKLVLKGLIGCFYLCDDCQV